MKVLLLITIRIYWIVIPLSKRKKCIFRESCSQYVHRHTSKYGLWKGLIALKYRYRNCRYGYEIFENPINQKKQMMLVNHQIVEEKDIAKRLL